MPLSDAEEKSFAEANDKVLKLAKGRKVKAAVKSVEKIAPWLAYTMTVGMIFVPRVILTVQLKKRERYAARDAGRGDDAATS